MRKSESGPCEKSFVNNISDKGLIGTIFKEFIKLNIKKPNNLIKKWAEDPKTDDRQVHEKMLNITNHQGNASQNHSETSPHTCQNGYYQKEQITNIGKNVKKRVVGNVNWCSHYGTQYGGSSKN